MPEAKCSEVILAEPEIVWELLLDKMENPAKYVPGVLESQVLRKEGKYSMSRRMKTSNFEVVEDIVADPSNQSVDFVLIDHPHFTGSVTNTINVGSDGRTILTIHMKWKEKEGVSIPQFNAQEAVSKAVLHTKRLAEQDQDSRD